jgi:rSAM/selenodomain-associated transferase 2
MPTLSVIVPVLHDREAAGRLLAQIPPDPDVELIVVDGGWDEDLDRIVSPRGTLLRAPAGRARQMNAGAAIARGEWLLFLHADSQLPADWRSTFDAHTSSADAGWFRFALDDEAWQARLIERGVRWRVRLLRLPFGDQGFFVRRRLFDALGGYRDLPLMEDVDFIRRVTRRAAVTELPIAITTSARRWRRDGWCRRSARNLALLTLYYLGVPVTRLARWYG